MYSWRAVATVSPARNVRPTGGAVPPTEWMTLATTACSTTVGAGFLGSGAGTGNTGGAWGGTGSGDFTGLGSGRGSGRGLGGSGRGAGTCSFVESSGGWGASGVGGGVALGR